MGKSNHIYLREVVLKRNLESGRMEVASVDTNHGRFAIGHPTADKLNQTIVDEAYDHIYSVVAPDIRNILVKEDIERIEQAALRRAAALQAKMEEDEKSRQRLEDKDM